MRQDWTVRPPDDVETDAAFDVIDLAFGGTPDPEEHALDRRTLPRDRLLVALARGEVHGAAGSFAFSLTLPGAQLPASGVTVVGVAPTARRRGAASALMTAQLAATSEPLAVLFASETGIYGRFGYGPAAAALRVSVDTRATRPLPPPSGRLRLLDPATAAKDLAPVYEAYRRSRPGSVGHAEPVWEMRLFDSTARRNGRSPLRCVLREGDDGPDGYALYRTAEGWAEDLPAGTAWVPEIVATTPAAAADLWSYLLGLDLVVTVNARIATDDPLLALLPESRAARPRLTDNLWLRLVDLPAALEARRYAAPLDVVLDVTDGLLPRNAGTWRLRADGDDVRCERTGHAPDLRLDVATLGTAYLGGRSVLALHDAGLVQGDAADAERAARAFTWPRAPYSVVSF